MTQASPASRQHHGRRSPRTGRRFTRHTNHAKIPYSVTCAAFRTTNTMSSTRAAGICGKSHRTSGPMIREERAAECESPEAVKINPAHNNNGNQ